MKKLLFSTIILIIILSCNKNTPATASTNDEIVATWRGGQITLKEYEDFAIYYAFYDDSTLAIQSSFDERRDILKDMIQFELIKLIADSLRLDTLKVMRDSYKRRLTAVTYEHFLYPDSVRRKVFLDAEIISIYNKMKDEGQNLRPFKIERKKIINYLIDNNKEKYNKVQKNFYDFLFNKYGVNIYSEQITDFVSMFNELLKEDILPDSGFNRFNDNIILASYNDIELTIKELLRYFSKIDKNIYKSISVSDITNYIFAFYYRDLIGSAAVDLGYTKRSEVLNIVNEGMILDYYEYLTSEIFTNKDKLDRWRQGIFNYYRVNIFYSILEISFYMHGTGQRK